MAAYRKALHKELEPVGSEPQPIRLRVRGIYEEERPQFVQMGPGAFKKLR